VEVLSLYVLECIEVTSRWVSCFGPSYVEPDHTKIAMSDRKLGDLQRAGLVAHRSDENAENDPGLGRSGFETPAHRHHNFVESHAIFGVQLGRETNLAIHNAIFGKVDAALVRDPLDRFWCLHDTNRVGEGVEVKNQIETIRAALHPSR